MRECQLNINAVLLCEIENCVPGRRGFEVNAVNVVFLQYGIVPWTHPDPGNVTPIFLYCLKVGFIIRGPTDVLAYGVEELAVREREEHLVFTIDSDHSTCRRIIRTLESFL